MSIANISHRLRNNKEIIYTATKNIPYSFFYASYELKNNKEFVISCINLNPNIYNYIGNKLKLDDDIIELIIRKDASKMTKAPKEILENKKYLFKIIEKYPYIYHSLSQQQRDDKEIAIHTIFTQPSMFRLISPKFRNDLNFIKKILKEKYRIFPYIPLCFKKDIKTVFQLYKINPNIKWLLTKSEHNIILSVLNLEYLAKHHDFFQYYDIYWYIKTFLI